MASTPAVGLMEPPRSIFKIAAFLEEVGSRRQIGNAASVAESWVRHQISICDIDSFLGWLHVDRATALPKELPLSKEPEKTLAPKVESPEPGAADVADSDLAKDALAQAEPANIHLWNSIVKTEPSRRRSDRKARKPLPLGDRTGHFANGYNGNFMLATLSMNQPDGERREQNQEPNQIAPSLTFIQRDEPNHAATAEKPHAEHLTQGLATQAFGRQLSDRVEGIQPQWNEPVRRDLLPVFSLPNLQFKDGEEKDATPAQVADPLFGQITLVAPSMTVAPSNGPVGLNFDWRDLAKGAGQLDARGLYTLSQALPQGSRLLYPAIDPKQLRGGSVNLRLEPRLAEGLVDKGYGVPGRVDAWRSARMASDYYGGTPPSQLLPSKIVPLDPTRKGKRDSAADGIQVPGATGEEPFRRSRYLDFAGLPIYLSPQLNALPDLEHETRARISTEFSPRAPIISPQTFADMKSQMFGGFYGIQARPDVPAWQSAALPPDRSGLAASLMSNRFGAGLITQGVAAATPAASILSPGVSAPAMGSAALRSFGAPSIPSAGPQLSTAPRSAIASSTAPVPSFSSPSIGSPAGSPVPNFIRYRGPEASASPTPFSPSIPSAPPSFSAPASQSSTAPMASTSRTSPVRLSPQITVTPEKSAGRARPTMSKAPATSPPPSPGAVPEGPKPARSTPPPSSPTPSTPLSQPNMVAPPKPQLPKVEPSMAAESPAPVGSGTPLRAPSMHVRPVKANAAAKPEEGPLAIQTATATPTGSTSESAATRSAEVAEKKDSALPGSEINLLANEVWILLKRRLAFEAQRMGR